MKKIQLNKLDFFIILFLLFAAPIGYTLKILYKNNKLQETSNYSIQISMKDSINNLNHYNFNEHFKIIQTSVNKQEKYGYFSACIVFNRYRDDLMMYNKNFYSAEELYHQNVDRFELFNWCLKSYQFIDETVPENMMGAYYFSVGLSNLYGFKKEIDISQSLIFMKRSYEINKNPDVNRIIHSIQKYKNIYPEFKDIYLIPYIDNEIKNNKIK